MLVSQSVPAKNLLDRMHLSGKPNTLGYPLYWVTGSGPVKSQKKWFEREPHLKSKVKLKRLESRRRLESCHSVFVPRKI